MTSFDVFNKFRRDDSGATLIFWALSMGSVLGLVALSWDIGRASATQSEMQSFADQVALAAAGELDGGADAITRANAAANTLVTRRQSFADGDQTLDAGDLTLAYYPTLPADDTAAMGAPTADPALARYVEATVDPHTVQFPFYRALTTLTGGDGAGEGQVSATAVAGFTSYACDITPMFFCMPSGWSAAANVGQTIRLRSGGGAGTSWGPGNFGFLELDTAAAEGGVCDGLNAAQLYRCLLGAEGNVTRCFAQNGVTTETGQKVGLTEGPFNTRFDIYKSPLNKTDAQYPPAPNVIKGVVPNGGGSCIGNVEDPSPDTVALPPDDCFPGCEPFGDGNWSTGRANYVATNYGGVDPHPGATTRWEYYKAEAGAPGSTGDILTGRAETGRPQCSANTSTEWWDRRTMIAAGVDCSIPPAGTETVKVEEWVKVFMLQPVRSDGASPPSFDILVEVVESASSGSGGGSSSAIHDFVQLYR